MTTYSEPLTFTDCRVGLQVWAEWGDTWRRGIITGVGDSWVELRLGAAPPLRSRRYRRRPGQLRATLGRNRIEPTVATVRRRRVRGAAHAH